MDTGKTVSGGNNNLIIKMYNGASSQADNKRQSGKITLWKAQGNRISIKHTGTIFKSGDGQSVSNITVLRGGKITATSTALNTGGIGIELYAKSFTNMSDKNVLTLNDPDGRYLVWTDSPANNQMGRVGSVIDNYGFAQFNKAYGNSSSDFQSNTTAGFGNLKTRSGFVYSVNPTRLFTTTGGNVNKTYDSNSNANVSGMNIGITNANASGVANNNGLFFKLNTLSGNLNKHRDFRITGVSTATLRGKYYTSAGVETSSVETSSVGNNLEIRFSGVTARFTDGNNKPVYGMATTIQNRSGSIRSATGGGGSSSRGASAGNASSNGSSGGFGGGGAGLIIPIIMGIRDGRNGGYSFFSIIMGIRDGAKSSPPKSSSSLNTPMDSIFNTVLYAEINGINMQAIFAPKTAQQPTKNPLVFQAKKSYKIGYKTTFVGKYDMLLLGKNIIRQKVVPLNEWDADTTNSIKEIFVAQT